MKGLKDILAKEIIAKYALFLIQLRFFRDGKRTFDAKFWSGIAKRKFMGLSYTGLWIEFTLIYIELINMKYLSFL